MAQVGAGLGWRLDKWMGGWASCEWECKCGCGEVCGRRQIFNISGCVFAHPHACAWVDACVCAVRVVRSVVYMRMRVDMRAVRVLAFVCVHARACG